MDDISYRAMMGEYVLYFKGKVFGGVYDDRFLIKKTPSVLKMMPYAEFELPYVEAYQDNHRLKKDWEHILSFHPKRILHME